MNIEELEYQISLLPVGYISKKNIRGKTRYYHQWKENGKLKSRYLKAGELEPLRLQIQRRHQLTEELHFEQYHLDNSKHLFAYAKAFYQSRPIAIGIQDYETLIKSRCFYIDKTHFISEWWDSKDLVTLITRPRRFGKTLNMSMLNCFFSLSYANREDLFEGFSIWKNVAYRELQGTYPLIFLSFGGIKTSTALEHKRQLVHELQRALLELQALISQELLTSEELSDYHFFAAPSLSYVDALNIVPFICQIYHRIYGMNTIILLDEYDTPILEAWSNGFGEECISYMRPLFNVLLKRNPYIERGLLTGITKISKESFFSDMNHIHAVPNTSDQYATAFGFTEDEVFAAMAQQNLTEKDKVKEWYDGFMFGSHQDIYNPWSILHYFREKKFKPYWVHTSSNQLINDIFKPADTDMKHQLEELMRGGTIQCVLPEDVALAELPYHKEVVWSLLVASGYLKVINQTSSNLSTLSVTNKEISLMLQDLVQGWFSGVSGYNDFLQALLTNNVFFLNAALNDIMLNTFSYFDTSGGEKLLGPERFYHGFILGLTVDLRDRYLISSNRESGLGRYDVIMEPKDKKDPAIVMEFKIRQSDKEASLEDTCRNALQQIQDKKYTSVLLVRGIEESNIYCYGFAFEGKQVLIRGK